VNDAGTPASVATRARIVLWFAAGRRKKDIAELAGVSRPTVDLWLRRYEDDGIVGLVDRRRGTAREQMPTAIRARILATTRTSPPAETGLSHWSSREMLVESGDGRVHPAYRGRVCVAPLRGEAVARDGAETAPAGHLQGQQGPGVRREGGRCRRALPQPAGQRDRSERGREDPGPGAGPNQPLLPIAFDATEKRTHDYV